MNKTLVSCFCFITILFSCQEPEILERPDTDWFFAQRAFPEGKINQQIYQKERIALAQRSNHVRGAAQWKSEGPINIGGRINDVEMPRGNNVEIWAGTASGGVFYSPNFGNTWTAMTDDWSAPPIGDIALDHKNTNEIWVGTGEPNGGGGSLAYEGFGILHSSDKGATWESKGLQNSGSISRIVLNHRNSDTLYAGAMGFLFEANEERGVFRSIDSGETWEKVLYLNNTTGCVELVMDPDNPLVIYASMWQRTKTRTVQTYGGPSGGVYKSEDGGNTWTKLGNGLPTGDVGRIGLAVAASRAQRLYVNVINADGVWEGFYQSDDFGASWIKTSANIESNFSSFGWWFCGVVVHPFDHDQVYTYGLDLIGSSDGGEDFDQLCDMHVDQHALFIQPVSPVSIMLVGNDGGLYSSMDNLNNCRHFENMPITQFYACSIDPSDSEVLYGGAQDNNSIMRKKSTSDYSFLTGGDGFVVTADPRNSDIIYAESQYGNIRKSVNGGNRFFRIQDSLDISRSNWNSPYVIDPHNPDRLYFGSYKMHRSDNGGELWEPISEDMSNGTGVNLVYGTITSISVSEQDADIIITGTDDGNVWITNDGGIDWKRIDDDLPERWVTSVVTHPSVKREIFVTFSGFRWNDYIPHVMRSTDYGEKWEDISGDLPQVPVNDLIIDPATDGRYFVGTDLGVFESQDWGETWQLYGEGMPTCIVNDLDFKVSDRMLLAGTYGRSLFSTTVDEVSTGTPSTNAELKLVAFLKDNGLHLSFDLAKDEIFDARIYSVDGRLLSSEKLQNGVGQNKHVIDVPVINGSIFILHLKDQSGRIVANRKLIQ